MDEAAVRQALIQTCHRLIAEWEAGHDWRWYGRERRWFDFDTADIKIEQDFADYRSLAAAWAYLDSFIDSMNHGFAKLDNLSWEAAFAALKNITTELETGLPVQNEVAMAYWTANNEGCNPFRLLFGRPKNRSLSPRVETRG